MKKISLLMMLLISVLKLTAQNFPAEGIGYQAMLSKPERVTYGAKLKNIPISNTDIKVRFELFQSGSIVLTDEHNLSTNVNGIFACIIGTGKTNPIGLRLSQLNWGKDSVQVKVYVNAGDGEFLFSQQKLWSTAYAMHAATSEIALLDNDTSATNELQYISLKGDSVKLTIVAGGISLKPWSDGIAKNAADIITEKNRAESAEAVVKQNADLLDAKYTQNSLATNDSLAKHRLELNRNRSDINKNKSDIAGVSAENKKQEDSLSAHRNAINKNNASIINIESMNSRQNDSINVLRSGINKNGSDITLVKAENKKQNDSLAALRKDINLNSGDIATIKVVNKRQDDSLAALRKDINLNSGDIATIKVVNKRQDDSLAAHRVAINKNAADIAKHIADDKDIDARNELTDLAYNPATKVLKLTNPSTAPNEINLSALQDNMGNHTATENLKLKGKFLSNDGGDEGIYIDEMGRVGVNNKNIDTSLSLDLTKNTRPSSFPTLTGTQRNKITNTADGAIIFNSTSKKVEMFSKGISETQTNIYGDRAYDGPIHGQTFQTANGGNLTGVNVLIGPRWLTSLAVSCKLYEGVPGSSAKFICNADSAITCYNPAGGGTGAPVKSAVYTFNTAKPTLKSKTTYYLEFSNSTNSQFWFEISNNNSCSVSDQITSGEYYSGSSMTTVAARSSGCFVLDLKGYIKCESASTWEVLNEGFNINEVDKSVTNELTDLAYNATTKVLKLTNPSTSANEINLSALQDNLGNHTATENLKLKGKFLSNDGGDEGIYIDESGRVGVNTKNIDTSLSLDLTKNTRPSSLPSLTLTQRNKINTTANGALIFNSTTKKVEMYVKANTETIENIGGGYVFDGPMHGQTFKTTGGGPLKSVNVFITPRDGTASLAIVCKLYEGIPGQSPKFLCNADSAITCYNPSNIQFADWKSALYTFNTAKPKLSAGTNYYLEFSNTLNRGYWFRITANNSQSIPSGDYFRGSFIGGMSAPTGYDLAGTIKLESDASWEPLNEGFNVNDIPSPDNMGNATTTSVIKAGTVTYPNSHNSTNGQVLTTNASGIAAWQSISGDNMGNATTSNQLTLNDVATNYSFDANNSDRGVIRMHKQSGIGSVMQFIAQGTTNGNFPGHMEFFTQIDGRTAPIKNMTLFRNGTLTLHNGDLKVGTITYPKAHNTTANQVLTVDASGNATWRTLAVISRNQKVGIGQEDPGAALHITRGDFYSSQPLTHGAAFIAEDTSGTNKTKFEILVGYRSTQNIGYANSAVLNIAGNGNLYIDDHLLPNGSYTLGSSAERWSSVWSSNGTIQTSDIREKSNISNLNYGIKELMMLRPVSYNWKSEELGKGRKIGFIAQELKTVIPETVHGSEEEGLLGVNYGEITSLTVKAIQEQQKIIENQQAQIDVLLKRIESLEKK